MYNYITTLSYLTSGNGIIVLLIIVIIVINSKSLVITTEF